jgi:hypothetical protein
MGPSRDFQRFCSPSCFGVKIANMDELPPIPETSPSCYLSGMAALNLISANGTGGLACGRNLFPFPLHVRLVVAPVDFYNDLEGGSE